jgi:drug/metabolite transporter (DMT)-like permease
MTVATAAISARPGIIRRDNDRMVLLRGSAVGLMAASIGALYVVFARWGIAHGAAAPDLTALRFGVAGLILTPLLIHRFRRDPLALTGKWRVWLAVSALAGTPFGLLMFGALQFAPASHAAVFPFAAMSVMGMLMGVVVLKDRLSARRLTGIAAVLFGLVLISGVDAGSFTLRGLLGDAMFVAAGTIWAGFGILLRKHRLDPLLATAVIGVSALVTYLPIYVILTGGAGLLRLPGDVLAVEALIQGVIAGTGTLFTYARMVSILGPARAAIFPALAPGLAALIAWPVLGSIPGTAELAGLLIVIAGLLWAVTTSRTAR